MMILRTSPASPFGRKVKIAAMRCGVANKLRVELADTKDPADTVRKQNPLGKIPVLVLENGVSIYDNRVICEYFDSFNLGPKLFPEPPERWGALTLAALADGIMDAAILQIYEKQFRPEEKYHDHWVNHQAEKVSRALDFLERSVPVMSAAPNIGHISLACALSYLDLRFSGDWRRDHGRLVKWLEIFAAQVSAFGTTEPPAGA